MFVAFAGGGAKALIHLGALRALEARKVEFRGLAGTSAGALVACLRAAGFSADDLLNPTTGSTIIDALSKIDPKIKRAIDFFGPGAWTKIVIFRALISRSIILTALCVAGLFVIPFLLGRLMSLLGFWLSFGGMAAFLLGLIAIIRIVTGGLAQSTSLSNALGVLLQAKMFPDEPGRIVRMRDFGIDGRPTLKIVSANLTQGRLHLFSPDRTPDVAVADAVAASISLPVIFQPREIDGELHMDGGIVSNLPAWPFDEERELDPEATTLAIEIETATERRQLTKFNWLPAFVHTGLFGSAELNLRASGHSVQMALSTSLKLLQFDLEIEKAVSEVGDAEKAASLQLGKRLFDRPVVYRNACKAIKAIVEDVLETDLDQSKPAVRVAVAIRDLDYFRSLRLRFSTEYETYHDEGMLIPIEGTVAGTALSTGDTRFEVAPLPDEFALLGPENRLRRKALRQDLKWILCVPISIHKNEPPYLVVQVDGGQEIPFNDKVDTLITQLDNAVRGFFETIAEAVADMES
jgi:NTE family protein